MVDHIIEERLRPFVDTRVELGFGAFSQLEGPVDDPLLVLVDGGDDIELLAEEPDFFVHLGTGFSDCSFMLERLSVTTRQEGLFILTQTAVHRQ